MSGQNAFQGSGTFENLQTFLSDTVHLECLRTLLDKESKSEASIRNTLALHYFQPLAFGSQCIIEKGNSNSCGHCRKTLNVSNTSLGHSSVWHGRADIVIKNSVIKVTRHSEKNNDDDDDDDNLASKDHTNIDPSIVEIELQKSDSCWSLHQALAEAIVNGFCEGNREKSLLEKFIPSFLATEQTVRIIWYNVEWDVLLLGERMSIWSRDSTTRESTKLNIDTVLHVWLALNFDNYDMDVKEEILKNTIQSNFKNVVGEKSFFVYAKHVAKPYEPFKIDSLPEMERIEQPDESGSVFAKVKEYYFQETKHFFS